MRLNGWQRLWVVLTLLWGGVSGASALIVWPSVLDVSHAAIYVRMGQTARHFEDFYEVLAAEARGTFVAPPFDPLQPWTSRPSDPLRDPYQGQVLPQGDKPLTTAAVAPLPIEVEGRTLRFVSVAVPLDRLHEDRFDPQAVANEYVAARATELRSQRARIVGTFLAIWLLPAAGAYVLGLAIVWVKRGFAARSS